MAKTKKPDIRIEQTDNDGFVVHSSSPDYMSGKYEPPKKHSFSTQAEMLAHVHKATGGVKPKTFKDAMIAIKNKK